MIAPVYTIQVNDRNVTLHIDELAAALRTRLRPTITALTNELLAKVQSAEPRRTGMLQSLTRAFVDEREGFIRGRVRVLGPGGRGHNIAAAALEYGAHRGGSVKAYRRGGTPVAAYQRRASDIAARRFLRNAAEGIRAKALAELQKAIAAAIADVNRT
jgi:hypothetical protein